MGALAPTIKRTSSQSLTSHLAPVLTTFPKDVVEHGINRNLRHYEFFLPWIARYLKPHYRICDLGAGAGVVPLVMSSAGYDVTVVDRFDEYDSEHENQMGNTQQMMARFSRFGVRAITADLLDCSELLPSESFDVVSAYAFLEHLPKPKIVMDEIYRLLRPGGVAVITVPNAVNLRNRLRTLAGKSPHPDDISLLYSDPFFGHYREMTPSEVRKICEQWNLKVLELLTDESSRHNTPLPDGSWLPGWHFRPSVSQLARGAYLALVNLVPSWRYDILAIAQK